MTNKRLAISIANDLETAERGTRSTSFIKALFDGALKRAMGIYNQDGTRGISVRGYLESWLKLQTHLNEGRKIYQTYINTFCDFLDSRQNESLIELDRRDTLDFIRSQKDAKLAHSTINNKLTMLQTAFGAAEDRGLTLFNIVSDDDFLDEHRLRRKPFTVQQLAALHERWRHIASTGSVEDAETASEWLTASKFAMYQGMRLGDSTNQLRANVDFGSDGKGFVTWMPEKTAHLKRIVILPLHSRLREHLLAMQHFEAAATFTPRLSKINRQDLCTKFKKELIATDIDPEEYTAGARKWSAISFHSHKHFYVDALDKALVPIERRKLLSAHSSDDANTRYLHPWTRKDAEVLRDDIEKIAA